MLSYGARSIEYDGIPIKTVEKQVSKRAKRSYRETEGTPVTLSTEMIPGTDRYQDVLASVELPVGYSNH